MCINKQCENKIKENVDLYSDYSLEKAESGNTTYKQHKKVFISNGLSRTEAVINAVASRLVVHKDSKIKRFVSDLLFNLLKRFSFTYDTLENNKKRTNIIKRYLDRCDSLIKKINFIGAMLIEPARIFIAAAIVSVCASFIIHASYYDVVLGVYANGNLVGYLDTRSPMTNAKNALESDLSAIIGSDYTIDCDIYYSFINVKKPKLMNSADCYRIMYDIAVSDFTDAYALYVDDKFVAASLDFDSLNTMLKQLNNEFEDSEIKNEIKISNQLCLKSTILSDKQLAELLKLEMTDLSKAAAQNTDTTQRLEILSVDENNEHEALSVIDTGIPRFSDGIDRLSLPKTLSDGTKITTDKEELLHELDLVYVKTEAVTESIPYETTYVESPDYYIGTKMLKTGGREGYAEVVYEIEYDKNGELSKNVISRNVIKEPVTEVIVLGTSQALTVNPSGNLIWPTDMWRGISSDYGGRQLFGSYDFHLGVDILNSYGKDIWAADSGVVTYAGYNSSYGYYVIIEHAEGVSTLYAHMSKIYTTKGSEVKQGDVIGAIGKTGVATAYHVHFEVRIDGKTVDPINYLPAIK